LGPRAEDAVIYRSEQGNIRMVLAGDAMPARRLVPFDEPDYLALAALFRGADVAFANLETTVREPHEGTPILTQGTPMSTPPALIDELKWLGITMMSCANNHAADWGVDGLTAMLAHLRAHAMPAAGAGLNLAEALRPAYVDTAAGRVALLAATSFFPSWSRAFSTTYTVDDAALAALAAIGRRLGLTQHRARQRKMFFSAQEAPEDSAGEINFLGERFVRGADFAVSTRVNPRDAEANLRWIAEARRQADWVIFSFHCHEFGAAGRLTAENQVGMEEPAQFAVDFARAAIDAGADVVAGHGPHLTLGVELHKGRPIFYSLGNLIFQNDNVPVFPAESYARFGLGHGATPTDFLDARTGNETRGFPAEREYWHGLAASCVFADRKLAQLCLHPLDLGAGLSRAQRGRPVLARGAVAKAILERVACLSARHGTEIVIDGESALVRLA
jgi:poly-gamma-glutamate capsule biosynthesis protein CapA/YwtB (metallophosphatase superfamily)